MVPRTQEGTRVWADCPAIACHFLRSGHQLRPFLLVPSLDEGHCPQCVSLSLTVVAHRKTCFSPSSLNSTHSVRVHSADTRTRGLTRERGDKSVPKVELTRPHGSRTVGIAARASESCSLRTRPRTLPSQQPVSPVPATLCVAGSPHRELTGGNTTSEGTPRLGGGRVTMQAAEKYRNTDKEVTSAV